MSDTITARMPCEHGHHESHTTLGGLSDEWEQIAAKNWCDAWQEITLPRWMVAPTADEVADVDVQSYTGRRRPLRRKVTDE